MFLDCFNKILLTYPISRWLNLCSPLHFRFFSISKTRFVMRLGTLNPKYVFPSNCPFLLFFKNSLYQLLNLPHYFSPINIHNIFRCILRTFFLGCRSKNREQVFGLCFKATLRKSICVILPSSCQDNSNVPLLISWIGTCHSLLVFSCILRAIRTRYH